MVDLSQISKIEQIHDNNNFLKCKYLPVMIQTRGG